MFQMIHPSARAKTAATSPSSGSSALPELGQPAHAGLAPEFVIHEESLVIKPWEAKFAEGLFAFIPTPRAAKRFSNLYRILKAPLRRERLPQFEGTAEVPGDFQVPMLLLATLIGAPAESASLFPKLQQHAAKGRSMLEALQDFESLGLQSPASEGLADKIRLTVTTSGFPSAPQVFLEWLPRVSRFSFDPGRQSSGDTIPNSEKSSMLSLERV